jgi:hypothetical protein
VPCLGIYCGTCGFAVGLCVEGFTVLSRIAGWVACYFESIRKFEGKGFTSS